MVKTRRAALKLLSLSVLAACASEVDSDEPLAAVTPSETEGPFFPENTEVERDADLTRLAGRSERAGGQVVHVRGRVLGRDGRPIAGARVQLWQANAAGRYAHTRDGANTAPLDPNFQGYALLETGADGGFSATTIRPGSYLAGQGRRTPHLHWKIRAGAGELTTQSYFPDEPLNEADFLIRAMPAGQAPLLIARTGAPGPENVPAFDWDVIVA